MMKMTMRRSATRLALLFGGASLFGCGGSTPTGEIDLGTPRQLVYITGAASTTPKHGGTHGDVDTVHVFDGETLERVGEFQLEGGANEILATPDGSLVWIVNGEGNAVTLLDTATYALTRLPVGVSPEHTYITPDHAQIWVGNDASVNVTVIDIATRSVLGSVVTGTGHHKMAFAEDDAGAFTFAYVSNIGDSSITPVTPGRATLTNVTGVGPAPHGMDYSRATHHVYNCSGDANHSVEVIATRDDPATPENEQHTIVARVPLESRCRYLHVSEDGLFAYATTPGTNAFVRIDLTTLALETYPTGTAPDGFEVVGDHAYVANVADAFVSVIDMSGAAAPTTIAVGHAIDPLGTTTSGARIMRRDGARLFVANGFDGTVSVIDVGTNAVAHTLADIPGATGIAVAGPDGGTTFPR